MRLFINLPHGQNEKRNCKNWSYRHFVRFFLIALNADFLLNQLIVCTSRD